MRPKRASAGCAPRRLGPVPRPGPSMQQADRRSPGPRQSGPARQPCCLREFPDRTVRAPVSTSRDRSPQRAAGAEGWRRRGRPFGQIARARRDCLARAGSGRDRPAPRPACPPHRAGRPDGGTRRPSDSAARHARTIRPEPRRPSPTARRPSATKRGNGCGEIAGRSSGRPKARHQTGRRRARS